MNINQMLMLLVSLEPAVSQAFTFGGAKVVIDHPSEVTNSRVVFSFNEIELHPGEEIVFKVPAHFTQKSLAEIGISHRQKAGPSQPRNPNDQDQEPGLTSVLVHSAGEHGDRAWKYWAGPSSGPMGAKFAEVRPHNNPEMEKLYAWKHIGYHALADDSVEHAPLYADEIKVVNTGTDEVYFSKLTLKSEGPGVNVVDDVIFTAGTSFGSPNRGSGKSLGGGQKIGHYPNSLDLIPHSSHRPRNLPSKWNFEDGQILITIPPGKSMAVVEVAVGDIHPERPPEPRVGYAPGNALLSIGLSKLGSRSVQWFVDHENVPPEGFIFGSPEEGISQNNAPAVIHIKSSQDVSHIMGVRIGYR